MAKLSDLSMLKLRIIRICRVHFYIVLLFGVQIMVYDAFKLIQPEAVLQRWLVTAAMFIAATAVWLLARSTSKNINYYNKLVAFLVLVDVLSVSYIVYNTRGMASRAVMLYSIPIIVSVILGIRSVIYGTAFLSIAAYTSTAVAYFVLNFNEGYKIELYGEVGFYSAFMIALAALLWAVINKSNKD